MSFKPQSPQSFPIDKFQKGQIDSKSVSETSVLVMTSLSEHLEKFRKFGYILEFENNIIKVSPDRVR
jgi:hypothetical protein